MEKIRYITEKDEFESVVLLAKKMIEMSSHFPDRILMPEFRKPAFFSFDQIFTRLFFEKITSFLNQTAEAKFYLMVLDPDPEKYFFRNFGSYSLIEISGKCTSDDYLLAVSKDPGGSPADAVQYNSNEIIIFSESTTWVVYGNRGFELALFAAHDDKLLDEFVSIYGADKVFDVEAAVDEILRLVFTHQGIPGEIKYKLIKNYK